MAEPAPILQKIKPKNARAARAVAKREPLNNENPRNTLFLHGNKRSQITKLVVTDLVSLKKPLVSRFHKQNDVRPFEDASSLEFFSRQNDASLLVLASHQKKRPHALTFVRCFDHQVLDMLELMIDPETMRTLNQFKTKRSIGVGLKPMICFAGSAFESPITNAYTTAKSILLDFFKGPDAKSVDVEGLQYMICISVDEEVSAEVKPRIHIRGYLINTKKSGQRLPRVEVEEMGPRIDFLVGRVKEADDAMLKAAMKRPKGIEARAKKNIETDLIGDKMGRIHMGKQDLSSLQTRKMKGLKRDRDGEEDINMLENDGMGANGDVKRPRQ